MPASPVSTATNIRFDLPGIAEVLSSRELRVPIYQRSYSWRIGEQVDEFWSDLKSAFGNTSSEYFMGSVVLARQEPEIRHTVIDGQQRLATTSLLLSAIRSELKSLGNDKAGIVERDYLAKETLTSEGKDPRLVLNTDDDTFFRKLVAGTDPTLSNAQAQSTRLMFAAYQYLAERIHEVTVAAGSEGSQRLLEWVTFLAERVRVAVIEVPTEADAYVIFETLNDRGADLTTADLLKNYLYGRAGNQLDVVRDDWTKALGALELSAADAKFTAFLRHYWSSLYGSTREKDLYKAIKGKITTKKQVVDFANDLTQAAVLYAAIGNPMHDFWVDLGTAGRSDLQLLCRFNLAPNRPLLLAAMAKFTKPQLKTLLRSLVSWSVRGMVMETMNSGSTEDRYCVAAIKIRSRSITKVADLRGELATSIASDPEFQAAFEIVQVTRSATARYYLAALERGLANTPEPELVPNEDEEAVNLEHVLPRNPNLAEWPGFAKQEDVDAWAPRLGNMSLLAKGKNGRIGNKPFKDKRAILASSDLVLTQQVGAENSWRPPQIKKRQVALAVLAVKVWPR